MTPWKQRANSQRPRSTGFRAVDIMLMNAQARTLAETERATVRPARLREASMSQQPKGKPQPVEVNPYSIWAARFWHGMLFGSWLRLLWRHGFRISITRWPLAFTITCGTVFNSLLRPLQETIFRSRLERTQIKDAPIFILGHWRSGTTLLHELMVLDSRYTFPTTYDCLAPNHFLISKWLVTKLKFLLPERRPMDNMETGWDRPQEEEFALCNMGLPSPYLTMAFPNDRPQYPEYFTMEGVPPHDLERWKSGLAWFLKRVTFRDPKRIILKSPPHTGRIKTLLEVFPDARFVHIVRDPYALYGSTVKLWKTLYKFQALQEPKHQGLEEYVFSCFEKMYEHFERDRALVDPARFVEVRYEDLVQNPIEQMRGLYAHLGLGEFEVVLPKLQTYFRDRQDYRTGKYQIAGELQREIDRRWGPYMRRYGYCQPTAATTPS
jgi:omega-hydroxy-beta-dihydromenaquinone-9 sulfotransferase